MSGVRETSIEAYRVLVEGGLLSPMRRRIYAALYQHGPCTANELWAAMDHPNRHSNQSNIHTRLGELRDMGVVAELEPRPCRATGSTVIVWDVTSSSTPISCDRPPTALEKARAYRASMLELAAWLRRHGKESAAASVERRVAEIEGET